MLHKQNSGPKFDFDEWQLLAMQDPDAFEQRRQDCITDLIERAPLPRQRRLRGLQFRIDMERRRARTPLGACIKISAMMWDSFSGPAGLQAALGGLFNQGGLVNNRYYNAYRDTPYHATTHSTPRQSAKILPFVRPN